jgi:hypothetical protein
MFLVWAIDSVVKQITYKINIARQLCLRLYIVWDIFDIYDVSGIGFTDDLLPLRTHYTFVLFSTLVTTDRTESKTI